MTQTALTQLEKWIVKFEETNGTPTMCEVKAQIEMLKEIEKEQIMNAHFDGKCNGMDISHPLSITKEIYAEQYYNETYTQSSE